MHCASLDDGRYLVNRATFDTCTNRTQGCPGQHPPVDLSYVVGNVTIITDDLGIWS